jgi:hypothetical protein
MNPDLTAKDLLRKALCELKNQPHAKINKNTVAKKAGVSHTLFRKSSYEDIRGDIEDAEAIRKSELEEQAANDKIASLETRLHSASQKNSQLKERLAEIEPVDFKDNEKKLIVRLTEMYRFNDLLRSELRVKYHTEIDTDTGELIPIKPNKEK